LVASLARLTLTFMYGLRCQLAVNCYPNY